MNELKVTPGPWGVFKGTMIESKSGVFICDVLGHSTSQEEDEANANLIAAAPELLEALQAMLNKAYKQNWNDQYPDEIETAQAAIARALGQ